MFLNLIGNLKESKRLKAVFEGDITPKPGEKHDIAYPEEPNRQDLIKKLIRYYYLTDHQVPTGKIEAARSKDLPELEHEYVLPIRKKISEAILDCRNRMREERRARNAEASLGGLAYSIVLFIPLWIVFGFSPAGKLILAADGLIALISLAGLIKFSPR